jgi:hypothetical protein
MHIVGHFYYAWWLVSFEAYLVNPFCGPNHIFHLTQRNKICSWNKLEGFISAQFHLT